MEIKQKRALLPPQASGRTGKPCLLPGTRTSSAAGEPRSQHRYLSGEMSSLPSPLSCPCAPACEGRQLVWSAHPPCTPTVVTSPGSHSCLTKVWPCPAWLLWWKDGLRKDPGGLSTSLAVRKPSRAKHAWHFPDRHECKHVNFSEVQNYVLYKHINDNSDCDSFLVPQRK